MNDNSSLKLMKIQLKCQNLWSPSHFPKKPFGLESFLGGLCPPGLMFDTPTLGDEWFYFTNDSFDLTPAILKLFISVFAPADTFFLCVAWEQLGTARLVFWSNTDKHMHLYLKSVWAGGNWLWGMVLSLFWFVPNWKRSSLTHGDVLQTDDY